MSIVCNRSVFDGEKTFGVLCSCTDNGSNDHPEKCTRSAGNDSRSNTNDVSGSDRSGKSGTLCSETGNFTMFSVRFIREHILKSEDKFTNLNTF